MRSIAFTDRYFPLLLVILLLTANAVNAQPLAYKAHAYQPAKDGYYFLHTYKMRKHVPFNKACQMILDEQGHTVYYKKIGKSSDFKLHPNGLMSYFGEAKYYIMDSMFRIVDSVACMKGYDTDAHDFLILPDGHYLLMGTETIEMDLRKYALFMHRNLPGSAHARVKCGVIQELDRQRNVVFEWHAKDHFAFSDVQPFFLDDTANVDWTHFNAVDVDTDGNLLVSVRYFHEITKISRSDGRITWRMGGKRNQFRFINDPQPFLAQHDVRRTPAGTITLFDNGHEAIERRHPARALEYKVDEVNKTAELVWSYVHKPAVFSESTGNVHRQQNGNSLVNFGQLVNNNLMFEMVSPAGKKLFELRFADTLGAYRVFHYPSLPWGLRRPMLRSFRANGRLYLDAGYAHAAYQWSNGATTQVIEVTKPGRYFVYVPYGQGFISSEIFVSH